MSKISIIVPVYYSADTLMLLYQDMKDKILGQLGDYELVFVDDGSADGTLAALKALAGRLNVTSSYLSSLFRKEMGMTLTDYVNQQRIAHAQYLLLNTSAPIKAIAQQCGIADLNYFVRMFKRAAGVTPKVYRDTALNSQQLGIILGYQENDRNTSEK